MTTENLDPIGRLVAWQEQLSADFPIRKLLAEPTKIAPYLEAVGEWWAVHGKFLKRLTAPARHLASQQISTAAKEVLTWLDANKSGLGEALEREVVNINGLLVSMSGLPEETISLSRVQSLAREVEWKRDFREQLQELTAIVDRIANDPLGKAYLGELGVLGIEHPTTWKVQRALLTFGKRRVWMEGAWALKVSGNLATMPADLELLLECESAGREVIVAGRLDPERSVLNSCLIQVYSHWLSSGLTDRIASLVDVSSAAELPLAVDFISAATIATTKPQASMRLFSWATNFCSQIANACLSAQEEADRHTEFVWQLLLEYPDCPESKRHADRFEPELLALAITTHWGLDTLRKVSSLCPIVVTSAATSGKGQRARISWLGSEVEVPPRIADVLVRLADSAGEENVDHKELSKALKSFPWAHEWLKVGKKQRDSYCTLTRRLPLLVEDHR